jgi:hypothetical protein
MEKTPGRLPKRRSRLVWIVPGVLALALGATAVWRVARGPSSKLDPARQRAAEAAAARGTLAELLAKLRLEPDPIAYVQARAGKADTTALAELENAYAAWASRGDALEARRLIVKQFLENPNPKIGFEALLQAVALDTTPRKQDPLWRDLVEGVGRQWNAVSYPAGRDLVHTVNSPKTKDLLLESLASIPPGKLTPDQQNGLVTDLIDLYPDATADQKVALDKALTAMAGPDVVQIMHGQGIKVGSPPLAAIEKINQEVEASRTRYKKVLEQIEKDEREAKETNAREATKK